MVHAERKALANASAFLSEIQSEMHFVREIRLRRVNLFHFTLNFKICVSKLFHIKTADQARLWRVFLCLIGKYCKNNAFYAAGSAFCAKNVHRRQKYDIIDPLQKRR